jgi:hypothetical protein
MTLISMVGQPLIFNLWSLRDQSPAQAQKKLITPEPRQQRLQAIVRLNLFPQKSTTILIQPVIILPLVSQLLVGQKAGIRCLDLVRWKKNKEGFIYFG